MSDELIERVATAVMRCVRPHLKHDIAFSNVVEAVEDALSRSNDAVRLREALESVEKAMLKDGWDIGRLELARDHVNAELRRVRLSLPDTTPVVEQLK